MLPRRVLVLKVETLSVRYQPAEVNTGDFLQDDQKAGSGPLSIDLTFTANGDGDFIQEISVALDDDEISENDGEIQVVLQGPALTTAENQSYRVGSPSSAMVTIVDNDAPVMSIANGAGVTEGTDTHAVFPITVDATPNDTDNITSPNQVLLVRYTVEQPDMGYDFVLETDTTNQPQSEWPTALLDFTDDNPNCGVAVANPNCGKTTANLSIPLIADNRAESNGIVRVTLIPITITQDGIEIPDPQRQYTISTVTGENTGDVLVTDNDPTPMLTIAAPASAVAENDGVIPGDADTGYINFVITSTIDLGTDFKVRYDPSEVGGNFLRTDQEDIRVEAIEFAPSGSNFTAILPVPIDNDTVGENSGQIQVELLVGDSSTETYDVADDGSQTQTITIHDDDAPVLSIGNVGTVSEWTEPGIEFPITALVSPDSLVELRYTLSENSETDGDFIAESEEGTKEKKC